MITGYKSKEVVELTLQEFRRMGGRARWKGISKKDRSKAMKLVRSKSNPHARSKTIDTSKHVE